MTLYRQFIKKYLGKQQKRVWVLLILLLLAIGLQLLGPQLVQGYLDTVQAGGSLQALWSAALLFIGMTVLKQGIQVLEAYVSEDVGWSATNQLRRELMMHALHLDLSYHQAHSSGEMIERIDGDVSLLANFFSQFVVRVVGNLLLLFGVVVVLLVEHLWIGMGFALFTLIALAVLTVIRNVATPYWVRARQASSVFYGFLAERLAGREEIRANGGTDYVMRRFFQALAPMLHAERQAYVRGRGMWPASIGLFALGYLLVFGAGGTLFLEGGLSIGTLYLIFQYMELIREPLERITVQLQDFQKAAAGVRRVQELLAMKSRIEDGREELRAQGAIAVELERVTFGYGEEPVLREISLTVQPGKVLGVLGRTGSGKSTLVQLLLRLYDCDEGMIRLNGVNIRDLQRMALRQRIGMVTQAVRLFRASVRDNVTLFDPSVSDERILAVLAEIGLADWCQTLPDGLATLLEANAGLSAGQAQLLSLARVFLHDPGLVILDEASSRLDPETERLVELALQKLLQGRTAILIAHRLQTLQRADEILVLEGGRVIEHGERERLLADPTSQYAKWQQLGIVEVSA